MIALPPFITSLQRGIQILTRVTQLTYVTVGTAKLDPIVGGNVVHETADWVQLCADLYPACFVLYAILVFFSTAAAVIKTVRKIF